MVQGLRALAALPEAPCGSSQPSATPVLGNRCSFLTSVGTKQTWVHIHAYTQNIQTCEIDEFKKMLNCPQEMIYEVCLWPSNTCAPPPLTYRRA